MNPQLLLMLTLLVSSCSAVAWFQNDRGSSGSLNPFDLPNGLTSPDDLMCDALISEVTGDAQSAGVAPSGSGSSGRSAGNVETGRAVANQEASRVKMIGKGLSRPLDKSPDGFAVLKDEMTINTATEIHSLLGDLPKAAAKNRHAKKIGKEVSILNGTLMLTDPVQAVESSFGGSISGSAMEMSYGRRSKEILPNANNRKFQNKKPSRDFRNRQPSRYFQNWKPSRDFRNRQPSRYFQNWKPSRDFRNRKPSRYFRNWKPSRDFRNRQPSRYFRNWNPSRDFRNLKLGRGTLLSNRDETKTITLYQKGDRSFGSITKSISLPGFHVAWTTYTDRRKKPRKDSTNRPLGRELPQPKRWSRNLVSDPVPSAAQFSSLIPRRSDSSPLSPSELTLLSRPQVS